MTENFNVTVFDERGVPRADGTKLVSILYGSDYSEHSITSQIKAICCLQQHYTYILNNIKAYQPKGINLQIQYDQLKKELDCILEILEQLELNFNSDQASDAKTKSAGIIRTVETLYQYIIDSKWLFVLNSNKERLTRWNLMEACFYGVEFRVNCDTCQPQKRFIKEF